MLAQWSLYLPLAFFFPYLTSTPTHHHLVYISQSQKVLLWYHHIIGSPGTGKTLMAHAGGRE